MMELKWKSTKMKKIIILILLVFAALLVALSSDAQIKVQNLPTTTTGTVNDFLIKDYYTGGAGSTQKITCKNLGTLMFPNINPSTTYISATGTLNRIPVFTSSSTIGNSYFSQNSLLGTVFLDNGKYISSINNIGGSIFIDNNGGLANILLSTDDGTKNTNYIQIGQGQTDCLNSEGNDGWTLINTGAFSIHNASSTTITTNTLTIVDGSQGNGKVLTSDANGNTSWKTATSITTTVTAGAGISITTGTNTYAVTNTGPSTIVAGSGISISKSGTTYTVSQSSIITSGVYTPTISVNASVTALSGLVASESHYSRIGNIVTVSGYINDLATNPLTSAASVTIQLPILSAVGSSQDVSGSATNSNGGTGGYIPCVVSSDGSGRAKVQWSTSALQTYGNCTLTYIFTYIIN